ncbi:hypothetical protein ACSBR2_041659 [Camellia fascicularis]
MDSGSMFILDSQLDRDKLPKSFIFIQTEILPYSRTLIPYPFISDFDISTDNVGLAGITSASGSCHVAPRSNSSNHVLYALNNLNLSFNNLSEPIPSGNQFQTFIDPSIYKGKPELCGPPLPTKCLMPNDRDVDGNQHPKVHKDEDEDENENLGFYLGMALGFVVGFWAVCGSLVLKKSWRCAYFRCVDKMKDWLFVVMLVNLNRLRRRMMGA